MRRLEAQATREAHEERQRRAEAAAERQRRGQKRRGQAPKDVDETPETTAQSHCTDPERHIMRTNPKGWDACGNAQARVDGTCQIMVACDVTDEPNDKQQAEPMAQATQETLKQAALEQPKDDTGTPQPIPATWDSGSDSEAAAQALEALGFDPSMATGRRIMPRRLRALCCQPRPKHRWRRKCGARKGVRCTPGARSSWNQCLVRSKRSVVSGDFCCAACRSSAVNGAWYA